MRLSDAECPNCGETWCEMRHSYACYMRANVKLRARVAELEAQLARQAPVIEAAREQDEAHKVSDALRQVKDAAAWLRLYDEWQASCAATEAAIRKLDWKE